MNVSNAEKVLVRRTFSKSPIRTLAPKIGLSLTGRPNFYCLTRTRKAVKVLHSLPCFTYQCSNENTALSDVDLVILMLLYHPAIQCGFDADSCAPIIRELYY